jgi:hypothetical protein
MWYKYRFYVEFKSPFPKFRNKSLVRRCVLLVRPVSSRPLSHHSLDLNCFHPCEFVIGYCSQIAHRLQTPNTHKISSVFIDISGWFASTLEDVLSKQLSLWPHPNVLSCYDRTPLTHHISSVFTSIFICLLMKPAQLGFDNFNQFEQWYRITNLGTAPNLFRLQVLIASLLHQDCIEYQANTSGDWHFLGCAGHMHRHRCPILGNISRSKGPLFCQKYYWKSIDSISPTVTLE